VNFHFIDEPYDPNSPRIWRYFGSALRLLTHQTQRKPIYLHQMSTFIITGSSSMTVLSH
jgi:hypothetical protein